MGRSSTRTREHRCSRKGEGSVCRGALCPLCGWRKRWTERWMDSCIISLSTEVSQGRGKGRETLGVDMFSYEIGDSGHASGFPLKKTKELPGACCPKDWWRGWLYHLNGLLFQKTPHERVASDLTFLSFFFSRAMDPQRSKVPKWSLKEKARPARTELPWPHFSWHLPR